MYFPGFQTISEISNIWPSDFPHDESVRMGWAETRTRVHTYVISRVEEERELEADRET